MIGSIEPIYDEYKICILIISYMISNQISITNYFYRKKSKSLVYHFMSVLDGSNLKLDIANRYVYVCFLNTGCN